ncbi:MAG TPA: CheR family methyltransferase, partial [Polyangiaceae bacterium]
MTLATVAQHVELFRELITHHLGLSFDEASFAQLESLLDRRASARGVSYEAYLSGLRGGSAGELGELARTLTTCETYFFRNAPHFRVFAELVLPEWLGRRRSAQRLRVLSAGCASGEEAYSLAIVAREAGLDLTRDISIRAVDANPEVVERAAAGRFTTWALRETPEHLQKKWFRRQGNTVTLAETLDAALTFEVKNLIDPLSDVWAPNAYDVIFCRNVMMYFTRPHARALVQRFAKSLAEGGYLFLGHAETLRGLSEEFELRHTHGTFYYQRKGGAASRLVLSEQRPAGWSAGAVVDDPTGTAWFDEIRRASERVDALGAPAPDGRILSDRAAQAVADAALELLRQERFDQAFAILEGLAPELRQDAELSLLRAVLLTQRGDFAAAEDVCKRLLSAHESDAAVYYVLALCREAAGDSLAAIEFDRTAAYLDPSFAMPRLHHGRTARA